MSVIKYLLFLIPMLIVAKQPLPAATQPTFFTVTLRVQTGNDAHSNNLRKV